MLLRKKIAGLMVLGASTLLPQTGLTLSAATYKVYYADQQGWQGRIQGCMCGAGLNKGWINLIKLGTPMSL